MNKKMNERERGFVDTYAHTMDDVNGYITVLIGLAYAFRFSGSVRIGSDNSDFGFWVGMSESD